MLSSELGGGIQRHELNTLLSGAAGGRIRVMPLIRRIGV